MRLIKDLRYNLIKRIFPLLVIFLFILPNLAKTEDKIDNQQEESAFYIKDMDINTLLKALSMKKNVNIVTSPDVSGNISLSLSNVNIEEALTAITKTMGLRWRKEGSIYLVNKGETAEDNDDKEFKSYHINYATLGELQAVITWSFEDVRVMGYERERIMIVEATPKKLLKIDKMIASLDIAPKQALIEAKILEINLNDNTSYGIDWGNTGPAGQKTAFQVNSPGPNFPTDSEASDPTSFFFGIARPSFYVKLSALEKEGAVETLATPRLMVLDGKSADIIIGGKLGYYLNTITEISTVQSVEYLDIGTKLVLSPIITDDGHLLLDISPEVSDGSISDGLPQKTTTAVNTSIMVKTGETVFIGGLIRNSEIKNQNRIPILRHIPWLGEFLFSRTSTQLQRKELIILLTPHIMSANQKAPIGKNVQNKIKKWQTKIEEVEKNQDKKRQDNNK